MTNKVEASEETKAAVAKAKSKRVRLGKTAREYKTGEARRRRSNQVERHDWNNDPNARGDKFPAHTLGGKGNSSLAFKMVKGRGRTQDYRVSAE